MAYWDHTMGQQEPVALRASAVLAVGSGEKKRRVEKRFGVPFNAWQVGSHLRRWGFDMKQARRAFMNQPAEASTEP